MNGMNIRVLLVTNMAPPYRRRVWERLGELVDLTVALLEGNVRADAATPIERSQDWSFSPSQSSSSFRIVCIPCWRLNRGETVVYLPKCRFHSLAPYDVVIVGGWESPVYWRLIIEARARGLAVLGFYESTFASSRFPEGPVAWVRRRVMGSLDGVIVPGDAAGEHVRSMTESPIYTGFNAVDVSAFSDACARSVDGSGRNFLFVGKLIERKNVDVILHALSAADESFHLGIVGSGAKETSLRESAEKLGVAHRVTWHGYAPYATLPDLMARYDTLVLVSQVEVWGLVVNEALAAGMQVIVSRNCGVARSVAGMGGVFVCDNQVDSVAQAMRTSQAAWTGRRRDPEILSATPEAFAAVHFEAVSSAHGKHSRRKPAH